MPSNPVSTPAVDATGTLAPRRRRLSRTRVLHAVVPYALIAPALLVIVAILGYPVYFLTKLSFQRYGLTELIAHKGTWVGLDNFTSILGDSQFWEVVLRTVAF